MCDAAHDLSTCLRHKSQNKSIVSLVNVFQNQQTVNKSIVSLVNVFQNQHTANKSNKTFWYPNTTLAMVGIPV